MSLSWSKALYNQHTQTPSKPSHEYPSTSRPRRNSPENLRRNLLEAFIGRDSPAAPSISTLFRLSKSPTQLKPVYLEAFLPNCAKTLGIKLLSTKTPKSSDDDWNDAWETAWLPDDLSGNNSAPWEEDVNFEVSSGDSNIVLSSDADAETKAFLEDMNENWDQRKKGSLKKVEENEEKDKGVELYSMENLKKDYRLKKQRIHAGLWMNEIKKLEEGKLGEPGLGGDDIDKLLDSCSVIFDSPDTDLNNAKIPSSSEFKNAPEGWETLSKTPDGSAWDMSQREEDILVQEFERRMAFCKFQIA
ncbi:GAMETE CELL DEFECTIVE 1, mitochondrial-like protein [Drosera capensis]